MSNPAPSPATRFKPGYSPKGRPNRAWMRKILAERDTEEGRTEAEKIFRHQVEAAQSWEVRVVGRDGDGELLKVASSRDSTEAAKFVFGLVGLRQLGPGEDLVKIPDGVMVAGRPMLDIVSDIVRNRLVSGQMTENELAKWTDTFLSIDSLKVSLVLKMLGKNAAGKTPEEIQRMIDGTAEPVPPAQDAEASKP